MDTPQFPPIGANKRLRKYSPPRGGPLDRFDKYFVIKKVEGNFTTVSPFVIHKAVTSYCSVEDIKKLRDGSLLVSVATKQQSLKLIQCTKLFEIPVTVTTHSSLNFSKGVVYNRDLIYSTDEEIKENLVDQGVVDIRRLTRKIDGVDKATGSFILTFNCCKLPEKVKAAMYSLEVRTYVPSPLRCFKCQRFGHISNLCKQEKPCCGKCGKSHEQDSACLPPPKCPNCDGDHSPQSRDCPVYKLEYAIQKIKVEEKLSYIEAKKKFHSFSPNNIFTLNKSYSSAAAAPKQMSTMSVQCSLGNETLKPLLIKEKFKKVAEQAKSLPHAANTPKQRSKEIKEQKKPGPKSSKASPLPDSQPTRSASGLAPSKPDTQPTPTAFGRPLPPSRSTSSHSTSCDDVIEDDLMDMDPTTFLSPGNRSKFRLNR